MPAPKISSAKTVYGKNKITAVVNCLKKSTQSGFLPPVQHGMTNSMFEYFHHTILNFINSRS